MVSAFCSLAWFSVLLWGKVTGELGAKSCFKEEKSALRGRWGMFLAGSSKTPREVA